MKLRVLILLSLVTLMCAPATTAQSIIKRPQSQTTTKVKPSTPAAKKSTAKNSAAPTQRSKTTTEINYEKKTTTEIKYEKIANAPKLHLSANGVKFTMYLLKGGSFTMGDNYYEALRPEHTETVNNFYIAETEVTQELWQAVMGSNPSIHKGAQRPVEHVSWKDCQLFIKKLNEITGRYFRLPSEAEWEYACFQTNNNGTFTWSDQMSWYGRNSYSTTHDVATTEPNDAGLYDMIGNVWEWVQDRWCPNYSTPRHSNPYGSYVIRGNCYSDYLDEASAERQNETLNTQWRSIGLRLAMSEKPSIIIPNGVYYIEPASNTQLVLSNKGSRLENNNIHLNTKEHDASNQWRVVNHGDGSISLHAVQNDNFVVDLPKGDATIHTNISLYSYCGTDNHKWIPELTTDGSYILKNKLNPLYAISVENNNVAAQSNVELMTNKTLDTQKWRFTKPMETIIPNGVYMIAPLMNTNNLMDNTNEKLVNGNNIQISLSMYSDAQKWEIKNHVDGTISICSMQDNSYVLNQSDTTLNNYANVNLWLFSNQNSQKWIPKKIDKDVYLFKSVSNPNLALSYSNANHGANVEMTQISEDISQKWYIIKISDSNTPRTQQTTQADNSHKTIIPNGVYKISASANQNYVIDNSNQIPKRNGDNIHLWQYFGYEWQKWVVKNNYQDGTITLYAADNPNFVLDLNGAKTYGGNNIHLYESNKSNAQKWIPQKIDSETYILRSAVNKNYVINLHNNSIINGSNIELRFYDGTNSQIWRFTKVK